MIKLSDIEHHDTDILILGSGGAGLFAALHAQQESLKGTKITLAVKGLIGKCGCTRMVQGGYNVALGGGDTVERHFMDTIEGGKWLPDQDMAWRLCEQAVVRIRELENEIGCFFDRNRTGKFRLVRAKAVLMATGGGPSMYRYHTPSGDKTMDGLAMALRAGLALRDMEMVQFHPTGLLAGEHTRMSGTVLEEGLRGAGGQLINHAGQRFMFEYDVKGERATRDIVSRAIYSEMRKSNNPEQVGVFISMSHLGPDYVRDKFKGMVKRCEDCGFDLAAGKVEVVPTAHYFMGGVVVDIDTRTALEGLYVAGEDAGGAHGSNRLGGNGVANSTVYGGIAGDTMAHDIKNMTALREPDEHVLQAELIRATHPLGRKPQLVLPLRKQLQDVMWDEVGVLRNETGIQRGLNGIAEVSDALMDVGVADENLAFNLTWHDWLNLRSLCDISEVIARAALTRENSRGAHFRTDYPDAGRMQDSEFTIAKLTDDKVTVSRQPVQFTIVRPGESILPEDAPDTLVAAS